MAPQLLSICQTFYSILQKILENFKGPYVLLKTEIHSMSFGSVIKMSPFNE